MPSKAKKRRFREEEQAQKQVQEDCRIANESADRHARAMYGDELWEMMLTADLIHFMQTCRIMRNVTPG